MVYGDFEPSFVFFADSHLREAQWARHPAIAGDAYHAFAAVLVFAQEQELPVVHGGDLFDVRNPASRDVTVYMQELARFAAPSYATPFFYIQGDHECATPAWAALSPKASSLHQRVLHLPDPDLMLYGLDFAPRGRIQPALAEIPREAVLITHLGWSDLQGIGQTNASLSDVSRATQILSGDYHAAEFVQGLNAQGEAVTLSSPGSAVATKIDEMVPRCFFVCGMHDGKFVCRLTEVPGQRTLCRHVVKDSRDVTALLDEYLPAFCARAAENCPPNAYMSDTRPIMRICYQDDVPDVFERLSVFADRVHFFWDPRKAIEEVEVDFDNSGEAAFVDLQAAVKTLAPDETVATDALRLLEAPVCASEYETMFAETEETE